MSAPIANRIAQAIIAEEGETPPLPKYKVHKKHYWMHAMSGLAVFSLGIAADVIVQEIRYRWPHKVHWTSNKISNGHRLSWTSDTNFWTTNYPFSVELGFSDDGTVYWRNTNKK